MEAEIKTLELELHNVKVRRKKLDNDLKKQELLVGKDEKEEENYWQTERTQSRSKFHRAVSALMEVPKDHFQFMKTHNVPPFFVKMLMDMISFFLEEKPCWEDQYLLLSDHLDNVRKGDADALIFPYKCKLVHLYQNYMIYDRYKVNIHSLAGERMMNCLADPRFSHDSFYMKQCGAAAPVLLEVIKANLLYVQAAKRIRAKILKRIQDTHECARFRLLSTQAAKELQLLTTQLNESSNALAGLHLKLGTLRKEREDAGGYLDLLIEFYKDKDIDIGKLDYYERLEILIEKQVDQLAVASCVERLLVCTAERAEDMLRKKRAEARARGELIIEEANTNVELVKMRTWIETAVEEEQSRLLSEEVPSTDSLPEISLQDTRIAIARCSESVIQKASSYGKEDPKAFFWKMLNGNVISIRSVSIIAWDTWECRLRERNKGLAVAAWESIFSDPEQCAAMAIEAEGNFRMTAQAKRQAQFWAQDHSDIIAQVESRMASEFSAQHPKATAAAALACIDEDPRNIAATYLAQAKCWNKLNPEDAREALEEQQFQLAEEFDRHFGRSAADKAVSLLNRLPYAPGEDIEVSDWADYAKYWRTFHTEEYYALETSVVSKRAAEFVSLYPDPETSFLDAARIVINQSIADCIHATDPTKAIEFAPTKEVYQMARCWGIKYQPKMELGLSFVKREFAKQCDWSWREFRQVTGNFRLGSVFYADAVDGFKDFRLKLQHTTFVWMHGYLLNAQNDLLAALDRLRCDDPLRTIMGSIRPSTLQQQQDAAIRDAKLAMDDAQSSLAKVMDKLSIWNSYFGTTFPGTTV